MTTPTYTPIATVTVTTGTTSLNFTSIPSTHRDLVLVANVVGATSFFGLRFNSSSQSEYRIVTIYNNGTTPSSHQDLFNYLAITGNATIGVTSGQVGIYTCEIMDYAQTNKNKIVLSRGANPDKGNVAVTGMWENTSAISSVTLFSESGNFESGTVVSLFGIAG